MAKPTRTPEETLYERVAEIIESARSQVARTVNTAMVHACWLIGREIVEIEQEGEIHAGRYQMYLPTEEELREEMNRDRVEAEQALRLHEATEGAEPDEDGQD